MSGYEKSPDYGGLTEGDVWHQVFVWWFVRMEDEDSPAILQTVWRKRGPNNRWRYRSFRSEEEKNQEFWDNQW